MAVSCQPSGHDCDYSSPSYYKAQGHYCQLLSKGITLSEFSYLLPFSTQCLTSLLFKIKCTRILFLSKLLTWVTATQNNTAFNASGGRGTVMRLPHPSTTLLQN